MKHSNLAKSPSYYELFAVIEAKRSVSGEDEAFEQLLVYTRSWTSPQEPGREAFVELLVNCSFCDTNNLYHGLPITITTGNNGGNDDGSGGQAPMWPSREHRRIVMEPVGKPLRFLESVPELIIVLHDAMKCHSAILSECRILHRDISTNNILVVRPESGLVRGMLIDFDCAIDMEGSEGEARTEITGTHPFMSVLNLENSPVKRTALDDWESLLYMICWLGTYGINEHTRRKEADSELKKLKIRRWHYESFDEIASNKRNHLSLHEAFRNNILTGFNPNMEHRTILARPPTSTIAA
ncbi:hypothetical protein EV182_000273 [Spiromyces aspiralis]|uniref:Uncharacterized protein n=1 Tax=Spiromyces aspiralis TaxID=68401 RepID=A0ACC1HJU4_9FUNG|nr:hypothetical protein EV182_000273 [Spiromyces aspiralis]